MKRVPVFAAGLGLLLSLGAGTLLVLWPCSVRGAETSVGVGGEALDGLQAPHVIERNTTCQSLLQSSGPGLLRILAIPAALSALGLVGSFFGPRLLVVLAAALLLMFSLGTGFSIGLFYLPSFAALVVAAAALQQRSAGGTNTRRACCFRRTRRPA